MVLGGRDEDRTTKKGQITRVTREREREREIDR